MLICKQSFMFCYLFVRIRAVKSWYKKAVIVIFKGHACMIDHNMMRTFLYSIRVIYQS